jgi:hypothetical protein
LILLRQFDDGLARIDIDGANGVSGHPSFIGNGADDILGRASKRNVSRRRWSMMRPGVPTMT